MALDFSDFFERYEQLVAEIDHVFASVKGQHEDLTPCGKGCSDCCHALFDVTLIEALYLNHHFNRLYDGKARSDVMERADRADRQVHKLKRALYKASAEGKPATEILEEVARARVRCALLGKDDLCDLYEYRPITCRLYGIPTAIGGEVHTCGLTKFEKGEAYPTVHLDKVHDRLTALSKELVESLDTSYVNMWDMLVPPSMALLTDYDEKYLGIREESANGPKQESAKPGSAENEAPAKSCSDCGDAKGCSSFSPDGDCSCGDCGSLSVTLGGVDEGDSDKNGSN